MQKIDLSGIAPKIEVKTNFKVMLEKTFVDVTANLKRPPLALSIGDTMMGQERYYVEFGTFGNFSALVGASKSKKTFFKSLLVASFIGGNANNYAPNIMSHRNKDMYVLDFDTEQGEWHSQRAFKRVSQITGDYYEMYKPFYLREYSFKERLEFIEYCILESEFRNNLGFVVIDGFADLVADVNNLESANHLVQKLLKWTEISKCHLTGVIHSNYGSDKATGSLGSAILKKAETICILNVDQSDKLITNVTFPQTRGFQIDDFSFRIDGNGLPIIEDNNNF